MKVSSINDNTMSAVAHRGTDIGKPGIYKSNTGNSNARLIVMDRNNKFYWIPGSGALRLQIAAASLTEYWLPVKEKITITFDNTDEE